MFRVGDMRHRVTFQREARADDAYGGGATPWQDVATVFAAVDASIGKESVAGQQVQASLTYQIRLRHRADITAAMRIAWDGKLLNIRMILPDARKEFMRIVAEEGVAQ